jgi:hypothetical protein
MSTKKKPTRKPRKPTKREQLVYSAAQMCCHYKGFMFGDGTIHTGFTLANALSEEFGLGVTFAPVEKKAKGKKPARAAR